MLWIILNSQGPEAFYEAQTQVYQSIEEELYPAFLVSETYEKLIEKTGAKEDLQIPSGAGDEKAYDVSKNYPYIYPDNIQSNLPT